MSRPGYNVKLQQCSKEKRRRGWSALGCGRNYCRHFSGSSILSHGKFKLANSCWQTEVGVCKRHKTGGKHVCQLLASNRKVFADCFYAVHTDELEIANMLKETA